MAAWRDARVSKRELALRLDRSSINLRARAISRIGERDKRQQIVVGGRATGARKPPTPPHTQPEQLEQPTASQPLMDASWLNF